MVTSNQDHILMNTHTYTYLVQCIMQMMCVYSVVVVVGVAIVDYLRIASRSAKKTQSEPIIVVIIIS